MVPRGPRLLLTTFAKPTAPAVLTCKACVLLTLSARGLMSSRLDIVLLLLCGLSVERFQ